MIKAIRNKMNLSTISLKSKKNGYNTISKFILNCGSCNSFEALFRTTALFLKQQLNETVHFFYLSETTSDLIGTSGSLWGCSADTPTSLLVNTGLFTESKDLAIRNIPFKKNEKKLFSYNNIPDNSQTELESFVHSDVDFRMITSKNNSNTPKNDVRRIILTTVENAVLNLIKIKYLENEVTIDPLTRCYNRRAFDKMLSGNADCAVRYNRSLAMIMFDIDYFKRVNDTFGHQAGDDVLVKVASAADSLLRKGDLIVRYGGEEFAVILPETSLKKAVAVAERLRNGIGALCFKSSTNALFRVTASFGVSEFSSEKGYTTMVEEADKLLYQAKKSGRNRVVYPKVMQIVESNQENNQLQMESPFSTAVQAGI